MTHIQILDEFKQLSVKEQLDVLVTAVQILQNKFHQLEQQQTNQRLPMAEAAQLLLQDYLEDEELTAFTALDGELFMVRSEVWLVNLDPTVGAEIRKMRPAIVVNDDAVGILPLKVIVPITDWKERYTQAVWMVKIVPDLENGLSKLSAADAFQVRSVSQNRFVRRLGKLAGEQMKEIGVALLAVLALR